MPWKHYTSVPYFFFSQHFPGLNPEQKPKRGKSFLIQAPRRKFPPVRSERQVSQQPVQFGKTGCLSLETRTGRIIQDFSIVSCSLYQRPLEDCDAMLTCHSNCWPGPVFPPPMDFASACDHFSNSFILRPWPCCWSVPPESRQRRHSRLQGCRQKRPEAQEEAGREEREGGVQEGARRRRWDQSSVTPSDPAEGSCRDFSRLSSADSFTCRLLLFAIVTSAGVREFTACSSICWSF